MLEQQLVDYIKKAKEAGQPDDQTRGLLYKNGWTEAEVNTAFTAINQPQVQAQPAPEPQPQQPQQQPQPQIQAQPEPQYRPQPQPQYAQEDMRRQKKPHIILKLIIALVIIFALGTAGLYVVAQYVNLPWNPFWPNPEKVMNKMIENMKNVKSSHTALQLELSAAEQGKFLLTIDGDSDMTDTNNPKMNFTFTVNGTTEGVTDPVVSVDASVIVINKISYFKINSINMPGGALLPGVTISQITGKWFKVDEDSIKALSKAQPEMYITDTSISQAGNPELAKKIQDLIVTNNVLSIKKQLGDQTISGQNTYHYLLKIDKNKLKDLITKTMALLAEEEAKSKTSGLSMLEQNMAGAVANTIVDAIGDINIEMWIGKKDSMLYKVKVDKSFDLNQILGSIMGNTATGTPEEKQQIDIKFSVVNSKFNKPVLIESPVTAGENIQKFEDVLLSPSEPNPKTQIIKNDLSKILDIGDSLFLESGSYSSLCNRGLLNGYLANNGAELIRLNNDIIRQGAKKPVCFSDVEGFCVSTQLTDRSYLCVDGTGAEGTTRCLSATTICK